jgi:hypothetical protein
LITIFIYGILGAAPDDGMRPVDIALAATGLTAPLKGVRSGLDIF